MKINGPSLLSVHFRLLLFFRWCAGLRWAWVKDWLLQPGPPHWAGSLLSPLCLCSPSGPFMLCSPPQEPCHRLYLPTTSWKCFILKRKCWEMMIISQSTNCNFWLRSASSTCAPLTQHPHRPFATSPPTTHRSRTALHRPWLGNQRSPSHHPGLYKWSSLITV